jgi:hypothetical protein
VKLPSRDSRSWHAKHSIIALLQIVTILVLSLTTIALPSRQKDKAFYGESLIISVPFPESEVAHVLDEVTQSGIIRGTKEYNKDEYISGAVAVQSTKVFPEKTAAGETVFYKVRLKAIDPRNFKDSGDLGTLAVRYIIKAQSETSTTIRIDARFVEDFRHTVHTSNGSVESEEYKDIHNHLDELELAKAEALEAKKSNDAARERKTQETAQKQSSSQAQPVATNAAGPPANVYHSTEVAADNSTVRTHADSSPASDQEVTLDKRVKELRLLVERKVKAPGAPLKSAPFRGASNLQSLPSGTEVLIVISTTYWLGVETHDGQHGWIPRDELEPIE